MHKDTITPEDLVADERIGDEKTGWQFLGTLTADKAGDLGCERVASAMFGGPGPLESLRVIPLSELARDEEGKLHRKAG